MNDGDLEILRNLVQAGRLDTAIARAQVLLERDRPPGDPARVPSIAERTLRRHLELWQSRQARLTTLQALTDRQLSELQPVTWTELDVAQSKALLERAGVVLLATGLQATGRDQVEHLDRQIATRAWVADVWSRARAHLDGFEVERALNVLNRAHEDLSHPATSTGASSTVSPDARPHVRSWLQQRMTALAPFRKREEAYLDNLRDVRRTFEAGNLPGAYAKVKRAIADFPRKEALTMRTRIREHLDGLEDWKQALRSEAAGQIDEALARYARLSETLPAARLRRGILLTRLERFDEALLALEWAGNDRARYWIGLVHGRRGQVERALSAWEGLTFEGLDTLRQSLRAGQDRGRLESLQALERLGEAGQLDDALARAREHLERFGLDERVIFNMERHLRPRLEIQHLAAMDAHQRVEQAREAARKDRSPAQLHRWFVACRDRLRTDPGGLEEAVAAWGLLLANWERVAAWWPGMQRERELRHELRQQLERLVRQDERLIRLLERDDLAPPQPDAMTPSAARWLT